MANQALAKPADIPTTTAILMFFQTMGGALTVSAAQAAFANELLKSLVRNVPTVNPGMVLAVGATEIRTVFSEAQIPGIVGAYMDGLQVSFLIVIVLFGISTLVAVAAPWTNIKGKVEAGMAA